MIYEMNTITPLGHMLLQRKKRQLEKVILTKQEGLTDMARDGFRDGFQDSFFLETQMNIQRMDYELKEIEGLLGKATITADLQQTDTVSLGRRIMLTLIYPSGEHETLIVVLSASSEMSLIEDYMLDDELPISPHSALGKAIYGESLGSKFSYEVEEGLVRGQILNIEVWQPAFKFSE